MDIKNGGKYWSWSVWSLCAEWSWWVTSKLYVVNVSEEYLQVHFTISEMFKQASARMLCWKKVTALTFEACF